MIVQGRFDLVSLYHWHRTSKSYASTSCSCRLVTVCSYFAPRNILAVHYLSSTLLRRFHLIFLGILTQIGAQYRHVSYFVQQSRPWIPRFGMDCQCCIWIYSDGKLKSCHIFWNLSMLVRKPTLSVPDVHLRNRSFCHRESSIFSNHHPPLRFSPLTTIPWRKSATLVQ